jgi:hypothetical protein
MEDDKGVQMKNLFLITLGLLFFTASQDVSGSEDSSLSTTPKPVGSTLTEVEKNYEEKVFSILDGNAYFDKSDDYLGVLKSPKMIESIGKNFLAEFYTSLGTFYFLENVFDKAGKSYHRALHMFETPDQHLSSFLAEDGVTQSSSAEDISKVLEKRAARRAKKK